MKYKSSVIESTKELSILDLSKTSMSEFWYDYVKPKYGENAKLCYMNIDSFIVHVKT